MIMQGIVVVVDDDDDGGDDDDAAWGDMQLSPTFRFASCRSMPNFGTHAYLFLQQSSDREEALPNYVPW